MSTRISNSVKVTFRRRRRRVIIVFTGILALVALGLGIRLVQVHDQTRDWRLALAAAPTLLKFRGHDFLRVGTLNQRQLAVQGSITVDGQTAGGGQIFVPAAAVSDPASTPSLVVSADGLSYGYTMTGGM